MFVNLWSRACPHTCFMCSFHVATTPQDTISKHGAMVEIYIGNGLSLMCKTYFHFSLSRLKTLRFSRLFYPLRRSNTLRVRIFLGRSSLGWMENWQTIYLCRLGVGQVWILGGPKPLQVEYWQGGSRLMCIRAGYMCVATLCRLTMSIGAIPPLMTQVTIGNGGPKQHM